MALMLKIDAKVLQVLQHCVETGGWLPDVDPVELDQVSADAMVAEGHLRGSYESGYEITSRGKALWLWGAVT